MDLDQEFKAGNRLEMSHSDGRFVAALTDAEGEPLLVCEGDTIWSALLALGQEFDLSNHTPKSVDETTGLSDCDRGSCNCC